MGSIKVSDFIKASRTYVQKNVKEANRDGNPYLTKAEAKALPRDLRDNFEAHRVLGQDNARVSVKKFEQNFVAYVAVNARKADKDGDGILHATDMGKLPRDLRDNFGNFVEATTGLHTVKSPAILRERLLDAVNNKDWKGFMELCDPENVKGQKELGVNQWQYIAEALGLHMVDNNLPGDVRKKATLDQLDHITLKRAPAADANGTLDFKGTATLKNGEKRNVEILGTARPGGTFWVSPAVG